MSRVWVPLVRFKRQRTTLRPMSSCVRFIFLLSFFSASVQAAPMRFGIDILWGRSSEADWSGELTLDGGSVISASGTELNKDESVEVVNQTKIRWVSSINRGIDSIHVVIEAAPDTMLLWKHARGAGSVKVSGLIDGVFEWKPKNGSGVFVIRRSRSDIISIVNHLNTYVFEPRYLMEIHLDS